MNRLHRLIKNYSAAIVIGIVTCILLLSPTAVSTHPVQALIAIFIGYGILWYLNNEYGKSKDTNKETNKSKGITFKILKDYTLNIIAGIVVAGLFDLLTLRSITVIVASIILLVAGILAIWFVFFILDRMSKYYSRYIKKNR